MNGSVNQTVVALRTELQRVRQAGVGVDFAAVDLDTGAPTRAGEYHLADETYRELLRRLKKDNFAHTDADLQAALVDYVKDFQPKLRNRCDAKRWAEDQSALNALKTIPIPQAPPDDRRDRFDSPPKAQ
jgi:hypothetical protein